ncbi:MAG TPA: hypothetical protein GX747_00300 [Tenericutes bacterium]|nr:hypothetical protein [Mycoplasmatota bacterium]
MNKKLLGGLCAFVILLTGCGTPKLQNGEEIIAKLDGKSFTVDDLYNQLKLQYGTSALVGLIDEYIADKEIKTTDALKAEAESEYNANKEQYEYYYGTSFESALSQNGFANAKEYKNYIIALKKQDKMIENYVSSTLTEEEIEKYYNLNIYGEITARHILIIPDKNDEMTDEEIKEAEQKALESAKELIERLDKGEDFAKLAKEFSKDSTASNGGLLDPFTNESGFVEEFWVAARDMEVGKYSKEPVETQFGYHIILKEKQADKPALKDVRDKVISKVVEAKLEADENLSTKTLAEIRKKYNLEITDKDLKRIYGSVISNLSEKK